MAVIFGSARIDERGKASGGAAGDQTGKEVSTQAYYMSSKGWYCLRPKTAEHAVKIAEAMKQACANNNIGYDQSQRNNCLTQLKKVGSLAKITVKTETDCSALVRACIYQATGKDVGDIYTGNLASTLESSGLFEKRFKVKSASELYTGDCLVTCSKGHTVVVTSGKARQTESTASKTVKEIAEEVIAGKWGTGSARKTALKAAGYDYTEVQNKVNELLSGKTTYSGTFPTLPSRGYFRLGDTLASVKDVELFLKWYGTYNAKIDTYYGPVMVAAVKAFQEKEGLTVDGMFGKQCLAAAKKVKK